MEQPKQITREECPDDYTATYDGYGDEWISNSALITYLNCGIAYKYRYIDRITEPAKVRLAAGIAAHAARQHNLEQKIASHRDLDAGECMDAARDAANAACARSDIEAEKEFEGKSKAALKGITVDISVELAHCDREVFHPQIQPVQVEAAVAIKWPGMTHAVCGKLDVLEGHGKDVIRDLKSGKRAYGQSRADKNAGMTTYGLLRMALTGTAPASYVIESVSYGPKSVLASANAYETTRTPAQMQSHLNRFALATQMINKGIFICCDPEHWRCSESFCGYYNMCQYRH